MNYDKCMRKECKRCHNYDKCFKEKKKTKRVGDVNGKRTKSYTVE